MGLDSHRGRRSGASAPGRSWRPDGTPLRRREPLKTSGLFVQVPAEVASDSIFLDCGRDSAEFKYATAPASSWLEALAAGSPAVKVLGSFRQAV